MNQHAIRLGRILGFPLVLDYSWFLIAILLTWTMATNYYPNEFKGWGTTTYWIIGAATAIFLFISVLLHELGHAEVARHFNIPVNRITLFIFGGVAEIRSEPPTAAQEFWIAIAGPIVSFLLAGFFGLLQPLMTGITPIWGLVKYLAYINGSLALFNLIPGFPLDGGRVLRAGLWALIHNFRKATRIAAVIGRSIAYLAILLGVYELLLGGFGNGLWIIFIGWFLENAASAQLHRQNLQDALMGHRVYEVMHPDYKTIETGTSLQQVVDDHVFNSGRRAFLVTRFDNPVGLVTLGRVGGVPRNEWPERYVEDVMIPLNQMKRVVPEAELWDALLEMDQDGVNQLPVMVENRCMGMLSREDVIGFLSHRMAFGL